MKKPIQLQISFKDWKCSIRISTNGAVRGQQLITADGKYAV